MQRVDGLAYRLDGGVERLLQRFAALGRRAAVVGPHGSGKTSLLAALAAELEARGQRVASLRLCRGERRLGPAGEAWLRRASAQQRAVTLILDGIDELGPLARWRVLRRSRAAAGLLVATHRRGVLPLLHRCRPDGALLADLVAELHAGCACELPPSGVLFAKHGGNLRLALRELYDLHAAAISS